MEDARALAAKNQARAREPPELVFLRSEARASFQAVACAHVVKHAAPQTPAQVMKGAAEAVGTTEKEMLAVERAEADRVVVARR